MKFRVLTALAAGLLTLPNIATAQSYPNKPIRVIVSTAGITTE